MRRPRARPARGALTLRRKVGLRWAGPTFGRPAQMPRDRHHWAPAAPFRLPNGAVAEGRPDLRALLNAREPHETLVTEGAGEKSAAARERAASRERTRAAAPSGKPDRGELADFIGADVPSTMLGSTFAKLKESVAEVRVAAPRADPLPSPRRPSAAAAGLLRLKDEAVEARHHTALHRTAQHSPTRTAFDAATALATATAARHAGRPGGATAPAGADGGGAGALLPPAPPRFVRVGVPVAPAPGAPATLIVEDDRPGSRLLSRSALGSRFNTVGGAPDAAGGAGAPASPHGRPGAAGAGAGGDALVHNASMISFRHATADLPPAATVAVRRLLEEHRPVSVAAIHQRRPPYLDLGPPRMDDGDDEPLHPEAFATVLRRHPVDAFGQKKMPFVVGCPPPWQQSKTAAFQTFEVS